MKNKTTAHTDSLFSCGPCRLLIRLMNDSLICKCLSLLFTLFVSGQIVDGWVGIHGKHAFAKIGFVFTRYLNLLDLPSQIILKEEAFVDRVFDFMLPGAL